jgi:hypothetical protein
MYIHYNESGYIIYKYKSINNNFNPCPIFNVPNHEPFHYYYMYLYFCIKVKFNKFVQDYKFISTIISMYVYTLQ